MAGGRKSGSQGPALRKNTLYSRKWKKPEHWRKGMSSPDTEDTKPRARSSHSLLPLPWWWVLFPFSSHVGLHLRSESLFSLCPGGMTVSPTTLRTDVCCGARPSAICFSPVSSSLCTEVAPAHCTPRCPPRLLREERSAVAKVN